MNNTGLTHEQLKEIEDIAEKIANIKCLDEKIVKNEIIKMLRFSLKPIKPNVQNFK